jgi:hypothetical protein
MANTVCIFDDTYANYQTWTPPSWVNNNRVRKFTHFVHTTPSSTNMTNAMNLAVSRNAGYVYITNDILPNPWDTLPTYWTSEENILNNMT